MQKVKSQHSAICWPIEVTQISREGVLGQSDPAIGKGLIGSLQVLRTAAAKRRSSRCNRAPAAPCSSACSLAETRLDAPSRRFHRVCSDYRNPTPTHPRFFTKQNGHLVRAGTLRNSALLTNLICGRGFGSLFRLQRTNGRNGGLWAKRGDICSGYRTESHRSPSCSLTSSCQRGTRPEASGSGSGSTICTTASGTPPRTLFASSHCRTASIENAGSRPAADVGCACALARFGQ